MSQHFSGMNSGLGNFLSLMSEDHLFQVFSYQSELGHLTKERVFQELKALITYGGLCYEQKALLYKVIADNYKDLIIKNKQTGNVNNNDCLLYALAPPNNPRLKIHFLERVQDKEELRVYHSITGNPSIFFITLDRDLKPVNPRSETETIEASELVKLMVEKIKGISPNFKEEDKLNHYYTTMDIEWEVDGVKQVARPEVNFSEGGGNLRALFSSVNMGMIVTQSYKVKDLYKSVGIILAFISLNNKEFIKAIGFQKLYDSQVRTASVVFKTYQQVVEDLDPLLDESSIELNLTN